jgi:hypothetical protein
MKSFILAPPEHIKKEEMTITCWDVVQALFTVGGVGVSLYALFAYGFLTDVIPLGAAVHPLMRAAFESEKGAIYTHAITSAIALAIGPFQVIPYFRSNYLAAHRWAGRVYVAACISGSVSAVVVAQKAQGGVAGKVGFTVLGVLWFVSTVGGFVAILRRNINVHRLLMQVSCALAYSAVSIRIMLPLAIVTDFQRGYAVITWLCWIVNLVILALLHLYWAYAKSGEAASSASPVEVVLAPRKEPENAPPSDN